MFSKSVCVGASVWSEERMIGDLIVENLQGEKLRAGY
jgi:hypothetical protein